MANVIGEFVAKIGADLKGFNTGLNKAESRMGGFAKGIAKHRKAIGIGMTAMGGAIVGALGVAMKSAADFEAGMREVNTMMGLGQDEFEAMSKDVLQLAKDLGVDAVESTKALYQAISAGVPKENVLTFMEIATKAAIGGVTDTETAVDGLTTVMNAFKIPMSDAQKVADIMFTTVKGGKTTFEELSASMFNVAPIAATAGIKFEEVSGAIAALTKQGVPTAQATTQIRQAIVALLKPTAEMKDAISMLGFESGESLIEQEGLAGALNALTAVAQTGIKPIADYTQDIFKLAEKLEIAKIQQAEFTEKTKQSSKVAKAVQIRELSNQLEELRVKQQNAGTETTNATELLGKMFGSVEGLGAVLALTGANAETFTADLNAMKTASDGAGASQEAFNEIEKGAARQFEKAKESIKAVAIEIGGNLLPVLTPLIERVGEIVGKVSKWIEENPELTKTITKIVAVVGALMVVVGPLLIALPMLITGFAALMGPIGLVGLALGALIAVGVLVWKNWDKIKTTISNAINSIISEINHFISIINRIPGLDIGYLGRFAGGFKTMHGGGVVPGSPGQEVPILAEAGETITPAGGGDTFIFNFPHYVGSEEEVVRLVRDEVIRIKKSNYTSGF